MKKRKTEIMNAEGKWKFLQDTFLRATDRMFGWSKASGRERVIQERNRYVDKTIKKMRQIRKIESSKKSYWKAKRKVRH